MQAFQDVFISYGRRDSLEFAAQLNRRLVDCGLTVWFDYDDIPLGVDYQKQIDDGIERADNFLFIISPHSVNSPYCRLELELALKHHKRIIPLLHVEQINFATWQQRNPGGTEEAWIAYQAQGLHDHFQNMHPDIRKINWVYVREGQDDLEAAFSNLLAIFERHQAYVHQHTLLLVKALEWQRQQKRSPYLLIGEERLQAEAWLKERFQDSQPPCTPTDLHCEFITESRKNADNLMTEVFLAYAEENRATAEQICRSLRRAGFTVWTNTTDIHAGAEFQQVIDRGIEEADNVVYLLSPGSVRSRWCEHELDYALSLHKRIIPVLVDAIAPDQIPLPLQNLQYIDLTDNLEASDYQQDESQLVRILRQDAAYHETHKLLLTKALKWERQQRNPTILLRGYNLRQAEAWLKIAKQVPSYPPLPLQQTFIEESLRQPPGISLDVFISYSRADSGFARKVNDALQVHGKRTWFDQESIAAGTADFQQEIYRGIESADNFLFILSPRSVNSPYCADEVEYAAKLNKRFITVLHQPVNTAELHPELAKVQWIDFNRQDQNFLANLTQLLRILDTDVEHLHAHTRLLLRAIEWDKQGRKESLLLRGDDLEQAELWLEQSVEKEPCSTELQQSYVTTSRTVEEAQKQATRILQEAVAKGKRRVLLGTIAAVAGLVVAGAAGFFAIQIKAEADRAKRIAQLEQRGNSLLRLSIDQFRQIDTLLAAMKLGQDLQSILQKTPGSTSIRSLADYPAGSPVLALQIAVNRIVERNQIVGKNPRLSQDGRFIVTSSADDKTSYVYERSGKQLAQLQGGNPSFSQDGRFIVTSSADDKTSYVYERSGKRLAQLQGDSSSFSQDGRFIVTSSADDKTSYVYERSGKRLAQLQGRKPKFSQDGQLILTSSADLTTSYVYGRSSGTQVARLQGFSANFSKDGQFITTSFPDLTSSYVYERSGRQIAQLQGRFPKFSRDGKFVATYDDFTSYVYERSGRRLAELQGSAPKFSEDGQFVVTYTGNISYVYDLLSGKQLAQLQGHASSFSQDGRSILTSSGSSTSSIYDVANTRLGKLQGRYPKFSQDGQLIVASSPDTKTSYVYKRSGERLAQLQGRHPDFSQHEKFIITSSADSTTSYIYDPSGKQLAQLQGYFPGGSQDGQFIVTSSADGSISYVYNRSGKRLAQLQGYFSSASQDGQFIVTSSLDSPITYVYNHSGRQLAQLQGDVSTMSRDGQFVTTSFFAEEKSYVYERSGKQLAQLQGNSPQFSPNGKLIVTSADNTTSYMYERSGKRLFEQKRKFSLFSKDGKFFVATSADSTTTYLYSPSGERLATLPGLFVNLSEDEQRILTTSIDRTTSYIYDRTGNRIAEFPGSSALLSPNGQELLTYSSHQVGQLWNIDYQLDSLLAQGCSLLHDYFMTHPEVLEGLTVCQTPTANRQP